MMDIPNRNYLCRCEIEEYPILIKHLVIDISVLDVLTNKLEKHINKIIFINDDSKEAKTLLLNNILTISTEILLGVNRYTIEETINILNRFLVDNSCNNIIHTDLSITYVGKILAIIENKLFNLLNKLLPENSVRLSDDIIPKDNIYYYMLLDNETYSYYKDNVAMTVIVIGLYKY